MKRKDFLKGLGVLPAAFFINAQSASEGEGIAVKMKKWQKFGVADNKATRDFFRNRGTIVSTDATCPKCRNKKATYATVLKDAPDNTLDTILITSLYCEKCVRYFSWGFRIPMGMAGEGSV